MEEQAKEKKTLWFRAVLVPEKGGGYSAYCPGLPGVLSGGPTREEALKNLSEAASLHLEALNERGLCPAADDVYEFWREHAKIAERLAAALEQAFRAFSRLARATAQEQLYQAADVAAIVAEWVPSVLDAGEGMGNKGRGGAGGVPRSVSRAIKSFDAAARRLRRAREDWEAGTGFVEVTG